MATVAEFEQTAVEGSDTFPAVEDTGWDQSCLVPGRNHVDALLEISEETFLKEQEPYEYRCFSGWEEAVHGWGRVPPLACIFLPHRKGKKPKNGDPDHHRLLCVDLRLPNSASSPEYQREPHAEPHDRGLKKTMPLTTQMTTYSHTAVSAPAMEAPEFPVLTAMQRASQHLSTLREKMAEDGKLRESQQLSSCLQPHHLTTPKYPVLKNKPTKHHKQTHRPTNILLSINNFTVLPPVELPQLNPQKDSGHLCNGESTAIGETSEVDSVMSARASGGVEGRKETREDSVANPELPKNTSAMLTSKYCTCQHSHQLLSAFSVSIPKRYEVPLISKADTEHRTSYSLGKNLMQALRRSSGCSRYTRPTTPQLPILLGTKVPMPASGYSV